ncbi:homoserine kinase [Bifidobacterium sp. SMB2]|uniref:Homoserine kinase n=1 Tax=Bifidobacterium saimiriisciurei TaxID=2661627 RepID=A0ABX0CFY9_9BIFI|nr:MULTISPECIES: homoserine kinase [Bifidobacterium]NEG95268.1 homoserine kinase [Bifidobacterium sp. SMB2]NEH11345.1 homoserine kinase [Bifidobacterium saimiriisciurei]
MKFATDAVRVSVPATSANLGPGFDAAGLALGVRDELSFRLLPTAGAQIEIHGEGEDTLPRDESHLVVRTFRRALDELGLPQAGVELVAHNRIPQERGMGSSAEAIVAGVSAAVAFAGYGDEARDFIFDLAAHIEGHPDNVAPAVYGGMTVSWDFEPKTEVPITDAPSSKESNVVPVSGDAALFPGSTEPFKGGYHTVNYPVGDLINAWVFVPDYKLSTEEARKALPLEVPRTDALFNVSRVALLPAAMSGASGRDTNALLFSATGDTLHQHYRSSLMPQSWELMTFLRAHGYASTISGAGPCVLVLHEGDDSAALTNLLFENWLSAGHWRMLHPAIDRQGVLFGPEEA